MQGRHLLSVNDLTCEDIERILSDARSFREVGTRRVRNVPALRGRTVANLFFEDSTRTRTSFEIAANRLSADVLTFSVAGSSVSKGETVEDTVLTLQAMGTDVAVIRHSVSGVPREVAGQCDLSVINAGDGTNEHPTQALLDLYTIQDLLGRLDVRVAIVGDVAHSRVAGSLIPALAAVGAKTTLVGPPEFLPEREDASVSEDLSAVLPDLDVCYMLRVQRERGAVTDDDYIRRFSLTSARSRMLNPDALIMHPGPVNRGVEIAPEVVYSSQSAILDQVSNGIAVRMAVLYGLLGVR